MKNESKMVTTTTVHASGQGGALELADSRIRALQTEAAAAGDLAMVATCRTACGDEETATQTEILAARKVCVAVLAEAKAHRDMADCVVRP